jgi:hypothetical protein
MAESKKKKRFRQEFSKENAYVKISNFDDLILVRWILRGELRDKLIKHDFYNKPQEAMSNLVEFVDMNGGEMPTGDTSIFGYRWDESLTRDTPPKTLIHIRYINEQYEYRLDGNRQFVYAKLPYEIDEMLDKINSFLTKEFP